jgi:protein SCO1/2
MLGRLTGLAMLAVLSGSAALADDREAQSLATSTAAIGREIPGLAFTDADGKAFNLANLRGKPALVTLIYTGCADVCPTIIENLAPAAAVGEEALGRGSFEVAVIGFDSNNDTPARMRSFARDHGVSGMNWHFLSGDRATLDLLTKAVGFSYFSSAGGFDHMAQVSVLDAEGRISAQVYGSRFEPPQIVEPLKDLIFGRQKPLFSLAGLADRVKLFCTVYNPRTGRYYFNYSLFASIFIGAVSLGVVLWVLVRETRKTLRQPGA